MGARAQAAGKALPHDSARLHVKGSAAYTDDIPEPRSLRGAWREMLNTWERQKSEPDFAFDTPLPATAKTERRRKAEVEEASIGDLAPEGLA